MCSSPTPPLGHLCFLPPLVGSSCSPIISCPPTLCATPGPHSTYPVHSASCVVPDLLVAAVIFFMDTARPALADVSTDIPTCSSYGKRPLFSKAGQNSVGSSATSCCTLKLMPTWCHCNTVVVSFRWRSGAATCAPKRDRKVWRAVRVWAPAWEACVITS